jgi:hypothetical protein
MDTSSTYLVKGVRKLSQELMDSVANPADANANQQGADSNDVSGAGGANPDQGAPDQTLSFTPEMQAKIEASPELSVAYKDMQRGWTKKTTDLADARKSLQREREEFRQEAVELQQYADITRYLMENHKDRFMDFAAKVQEGGGEQPSQDSQTSDDLGWQSTEDGEVKKLRQEMAEMKKAHKQEMDTHMGYIRAFGKERIDQQFDKLQSDYPDAEGLKDEIFSRLQKYGNAGMTIDEAYRAAGGSGKTAAQAEQERRNASVLPSPYAPQGNVANTTWDIWKTKSERPSLEGEFNKLLDLSRQAAGR